jgi:hypothetical protein
MIFMFFNKSGKRILLSNFLLNKKNQDLKWNLEM